MGYPMTWKRLLNRNGLTDGDYEKVPAGWYSPGPVTVSEDPLVQSLIRTWMTERQNLQQRLRLFAGDLRRLEHDTVDEGWICKHITRTTGVDEDTVAAVLKAYWEA